MGNYNLVHFDAARAALQKAATIDEVKTIRNKAEALRAYARQSGEGLLMQNKCAEIRIRAERRAGEMLREMEKQHGARDGKTESHHVTPLLSDLGITKMQSSRWQEIALIPDNTFEKYITEIIQHAQELTGVGIRKLAKGIKHESTIDELKSHESETCTIDDLDELINAEMVFSTIYADPPWQYSNQGTRAATDNHYETLTAEQIGELPIEKLAAPSAHLHLWTTNAFLPDSFEIIKRWGFEYKSCFVWVKPQMGIGNYWRVSHEFMLLGVRGNCPFLDRSCMSWIEIARGEHSAKPDIVRQNIERVSPAPRLELFARSAIDGWVCWGNEIKRNLFTMQIKNR